MNEAPTVVGVVGSLREGSYTRVAVERALEAAAAGAHTDCIDLGEHEVPVFDPDRDVTAQGDAAELVARVNRADAVVLGSPVYHGSYSGALKNFHDYCGHDEYEDTVAGLVAVAGGEAYQSTLDHMRITVRGVHGWVLPDQVGIQHASNRFGTVDGERRITDQGLRERITALGETLVAHATPSTAESPAAHADD